MGQSRHSRRVGLLEGWVGQVLSRRTAQELADPFLVIRVKSLLILSMVGLATLTLFGLVNYFNNVRGIAAYELIAAGTLFINIWLLVRLRHLTLSTNLILALLVPLMLYLVYNGGIAGSGVVWLFAFPAAAFYLAGLRTGIIWMLVLSVGLGIMALMQAQGTLQTHYSLLFLRQLAAGLTVVTLIIYFHERVTESAQSLAIRRSIEQEVLNEQLAMGKRNIEIAGVRNEALLQSIGDGIIATDKEGRILLANQAALNLLKLKLEDLLGKTITVFRVETEDGKPIPYEDRILTKVLRTNRTIHTTANSRYYYVDSTGRRFPAASTQTPIIIDGKNHGAVCVFRDATQEKRLDEAKTELVSLASHQLNGPLTAVSWYTEMLMGGEAGKLTKMQKDYLEEIYAGNTKMVELVNDFLNASRIELGTFVPKYQPVDVVELAKEALAEIGPEASRKKLALKQNFPDMGRLMLDKRTVQIIFQNLLTNAVKYTDSGSISIELGLSGTGRHRRVNIAVSDTGLGIPAADQPRIFQKMYRADNAKVAEAEGTGLGLYIIKSIVDQLHGTISMKSKEGVGTRFDVELPAPPGSRTAPAHASGHHHRST